MNDMSTIRIRLLIDLMDLKGAFILVVNKSIDYNISDGGFGFVTCCKLNRLNEIIWIEGLAEIMFN